MLSLETTQEEILEFLRDSFVQPVVEQAIPDIDNVLRNAAGDIEPYYAIQFGDLQQGRISNVAYVKGDDYVLPIYVQAVAPTAEIARKLYNRVIDKFLGESFPYAGVVRKRPGGGMFPLVGSNAATEAYEFPASFGLLIQLLDIETPEP